MRRVMAGWQVLPTRALAQLDVAENGLTRDGRAALLRAAQARPLEIETFRGDLYHRCANGAEEEPLDFESDHGDLFHRSVTRAEEAPQGVGTLTVNV